MRCRYIVDAVLIEDSEGGASNAINFFSFRARETSKGENSCDLPWVISKLTLASVS